MTISDYANTGTLTMGNTYNSTHTISTGDWVQEIKAWQHQKQYVNQSEAYIGYLQVLGGTLSGEKPIVICNGQHHEAKDLVTAQAMAEKLAHQHNTDAYVLKPIKKVAPKRDVVTTELE